jgi:predicted aconitase
MYLDEQEQAVLAGERDPALQKVLRSVIAYGDVFGAERLVPLSGAPHFVTSFGASMIGSYFGMLDELVAAGLRSHLPFTVDPRPLDPAVGVNPLEALAFRFIFGKQGAYEQQLARLGLKDERGFSCACYLPEVGNRPGRGDVLAWSESSAVAFANSVLAARSNRTSAGIDVLCAVLGKAPLFGLLTDAGRRATWLVEVRSRSLPNAQLLGGAIGAKVVEDVPYVVGLDQYLGAGLGQATQDYLKDLGAAAASNGAVGLCHVENVTPEAAEQGRALLAPGYHSYVVDEAELARLYSSYPESWRGSPSGADICFLGCPHLSLAQIHNWSERLRLGLKGTGRTKLAMPTYLCAPPDVIARFTADVGALAALRQTGARLAALCPLMWLNNPLCARRKIVTNSNKLRTYTAARYLLDDELVAVVTGATGGR